MLPLRLSLRNFMSYRDNVPTLNLEGHHLLCLSGNNGHGKSALLDAITWALWGKSRAKSDDDLIHHGELSMEATLDFRAQGNLYRVIRKRTKGSGRRPGTSLLELQSLSGDSPRPITENRLEDTQQKIKDILRLDYPTFINSAFLVQGKADLFTTATPAERKEVLAEVLELSYYDKLEEMARARSKQSELEQQSIARELEAIRNELADKSRHEEALANQKALLEELAGGLSAQARSLDDLRRQTAALEGLTRQLQESQGQKHRLEEELRHLGSLYGEREKQLAAYGAIIAQSDPISQGYAKLQLVSQSKEDMDARVARFTSLSQTVTRLEGAIEAHRRDLLSQANALRQRYQEISTRADQSAALSQRVLELQGALLEVDARREDARRRRESLQELFGQIQSVKASQGQLRQEMEDLRSKISSLSGVDATCPLCGTHLGAEKREDIIQHYENEGLQRKEAFLRLEGTLKEKNREHSSLRQEVEALEKTLDREGGRRQASLATAQERLKESQRASQELVPLKEQIDALSQQLEEATFSLDERERLAKATADLGSLGYDSGSHEALRKEYALLRAFDNQFRQLQEAERELPRLRQSLLESKSLIDSLQAQLQDMSQRITALETEAARLPELRVALAREESSYQGLLARRDEQARLIGALEEKLARLALLERSQADKERTWATAAEDKGIYDELALAFGKNGIQAFIIENALPELEEEANRILHRMTDNRMSVRIETQRLTQRRETRETLDIRVSDELGTRSFEMFSGGEAFRISFALRIALSGLLARRAGAPLPTLFIDEGFGTQDAEGRERLVEAINAIQDDFQLIIVITHIEELKEMFPVRIEVSKTPHGSTFWLT